MKNILFLAFAIFLAFGFQTSARANPNSGTYGLAQPPNLRPYPGHHHYPNNGYPYSYSYPRPYPYPYSYSYPYPAPYPNYPYPTTGYVTCYAQSLTTGMIFYGVSYNVYMATQYAVNTCSASGQYCQPIGCQY